MLCSTHRRPTKNETPALTGWGFSLLHPATLTATGHTAPLQAAQHPRQYPCGTLLVIVAYAARYAAQFAEAAQAAFD